MIITALKQTVERGRGIAKPLYVRNLLKEDIQNYVLHYVYNSRQYKELIFTGGTALRKVYGLPRLSEDLDFDYTGAFDIETFASDVKKHFASSLQYAKVTTKISVNRNTVYIKFPILKELGLTDKEEVLFVRCDFSAESAGGYGAEVSAVSTPDFTFFVRHYDLATLFANKITAFLKRDFFKGRHQTISFKARDVFDLVWFVEKGKKSGGDLQPNWKRLQNVFPGQSRNEIIQAVIEKTLSINESEIRRDLDPFLETEVSVTAFSGAFKDIIKNGFRSYMQR